MHFCFFSLLYIATLFGNGSASTIEQSYLVVLDQAATEEEGMYQNEVTPYEQLQ